MVLTFQVLKCEHHESALKALLNGFAIEYDSLISEIKMDTAHIRVEYHDYDLRFETGIP